MKTFKEIFNYQGPLLIDGAIGSNLMARGLEPGQAPEELLFSSPETLKSLHRDFIASGSDIVLTNSFGGNARRLRLHGLQDSVAQVNSLAAKLARDAAEEIGKPSTLVAGSMGPTGDLLEPLGTLSISEAVNIFSDQAKGLADGGADLIWIETLAAKNEILAAVEGASIANLPIALTLSFDSAGKTMMGISPADFAALADDLPIAAYGANCGAGLSDISIVMVEMAEARNSTKALISKGNAGIPKFENGAIRYDGTPILMGAYANLMQSVGVDLIGGCCGTTPRHIKAMRAALNGPNPINEPKLDRKDIELLLGASNIKEAPVRERRSRRRAA